MSAADAGAWVIISNTRTGRVSRRWFKRPEKARAYARRRADQLAGGKRYGSGRVHRIEVRPA